MEGERERKKGVNAIERRARGRERRVRERKGGGEGEIWEGKRGLRMEEDRK